VLFGENVPKPRVDSAMSSLLASDALLILGTSVQVRIPKCSYDFQLPRRCSCR
jgi:NAD-dependent SIR2 family protein deacetylase